MRIFKMLLQFLYLILTILFAIGVCLSKPLTKDVLKYLDSDKLTYATYKDDYKKLACKLLTFSRMKNLYDEEVIDKYLGQIENKIGYLEILQEKMKEKCMHTLDNNMVCEYI
jgi:hypothetical protein